MLRARVDDPDGPAFATWGWSRSADKSSWSTTLSRSHDYTPREADRGMYLRAVGTYTEGATSKTLEVVTGSVVDSAEAAPELVVTDFVTGLTIPWDLAFAPTGRCCSPSAEGR